MQSAGCSDVSPNSVCTHEDECPSMAGLPALSSIRPPTSSSFCLPGTQPPAGRHRGNHGQQRENDPAHRRTSSSTRSEPIRPATPRDLAPGVRDSHSRRSIKRGAVRVQGRPIHHGVAGSAMPAGMTASAVSEAGDVSDEDLIQTETVSVRASGRHVRDPLPGRGRYTEVAQHT